MLNEDYYKQVFHEIKNSVTLINSYLQLIEKNYPEIKQYNYWTCSRTEAARLRAITSEISQVKTDSYLQMELIDLRDFIADCCSGFCWTAGAEGLACGCALTLPQNPLMVLADSKQLRHAVMNLLKNSCEAMEHQGEILVEALPAVNYCLIRITDSGCGIAPDVLEHIFDPFVTTKEDGSGLGLNIASQIITAHHGTICGYKARLRLYLLLWRSLPSHRSDKTCRNFNLRK